MIEHLNEVIRIVFWLVITAFMLCLFKSDIKSFLKLTVSFMQRNQQDLTATFSWTEDEQKTSNEMFDKYRDDMLKRQLSNSENYDKALLSLSTAGLALSISAIKFIIDLKTVDNLLLLKISWFLFFVVIATTIIAYLIGNAAITKQLKLAEDYYINRLVHAQTQKNWLASFNSFLNVFTGIVFVIAIFLTIFFITINIKG